MRYIFWPKSTHRFIICSALLTSIAKASALTCSTDGDPWRLQVANLDLSYVENGQLDLNSINALEAIIESSDGETLRLEIKHAMEPIEYYGVTPGKDLSQDWIKKLKLEENPELLTISKPLYGPLYTPPMDGPTQVVSVFDQQEPIQPPLIDPPRSAIIDEPEIKELPTVGEKRLPQISASGDGGFIQPAPIGDIELIEIGNSKVSESTVLISFKIKERSGSGKCNGLNLGKGRVLTNAHCFPEGAYEHTVWFGDIDWVGSATGGPSRSNLACQAERVQDFRPLVTSLNRETSSLAILDLAILQVSPEDVEILDDRFLYSQVYIPKEDPWCTKDQGCKSPTTLLPDIVLSVSQVWTQRADLLPGATERRKLGTKVMSNNGLPYFDEETYEFKPKVCSSKINGDAILDVTNLSEICDAAGMLANFGMSVSPYGHVHDCDTVPGSSGAPVFRQSDLDEFYEQPFHSRLPLAGIHRAGQTDVANCLIPASLIYSSLKSLDEGAQ